MTGRRIKHAEHLLGSAICQLAWRQAYRVRRTKRGKQTYTTLAENEEWMAVHIDRTIQRRKNYDNHAALAEEEEQILKCLGAAVLMRWNTVPTKLQRELFVLL